MTPGAPSSFVRRLNHVEFVYCPGERDLVLALFDLLDLEAGEAHGGRFLMGGIDRTDPLDNFVTGSEVSPEQWVFDQALTNALREGPLATAFGGYQALLGRAPQCGMHFGISYESLDEWEATVARVRDVDAHTPALADRVQLRGVYRPGELGAISEITCQAFVWTDVIASGSLALGQQIELMNTDKALQRDAVTAPTRQSGPPHA
jgi:hypothetical protein